MNKQPNNTSPPDKPFGHIHKDVILKNFWRDNEHFADLFNAVIFNGEQLLTSDNLTEMDTDVSTTIKSKIYNESITRNRDVVKKMCDGIKFNILGLEIQDKTHYAMPLRTMTYDALGYIKEYNLFKKRHKLNNDLSYSSESFLSGINKDDLFHPIITLVLYYGETPWDGPLCLSDMMIHMSERIKPYFSNYRLNLIQILDSDRFPFYNEDVKNLFDIIRLIYQKDMKSIYNKYEFTNVDYDVIELISIITDNPRLLKLYNNTQSNTSSAIGGDIMCKAFKELEAEWMERGIEQGIERGIEQGFEQGIEQGIEQGTQHAIITMLEFGITKEQILTKYSNEELKNAEAAMLNSKCNN